MQTTQQFSLFPETLKSQVYLDLDIELSSQLNIDLIPARAGVTQDFIVAIGFINNIYNWDRRQPVIRELTIYNPRAAIVDPLTIKLILCCHILHWFRLQ